MSSTHPMAATTSTTGAASDRAEQACERCRTHKSKCVPSGLTDRCNRCYQSRLTCVFDKTKKRRRRESAAQGVSAKKVAMIEEKLDKVFSMLTPEAAIGQGLLTPELSASDNAQTTPSGAQWSNQPVRPNPSAILPPSPILQQHDSFGDRLLHAVSINSAGADTFRSICHEQAQIVIGTSKSLSFGLGSYIHNNGPLSELLSSDYALVIAAMLAAAGNIHQLDSALLACEFRQIMSENLFSKGKRNVYVLQSLLIFLLRHVYYMNNKGPSVVMMENICLSQIIDLGIDKRPVYHRVEDIVGDEPDRMEEQAQVISLLVCNYLSCGLSFKCQNARMGLHLAERARQSIESFLKDNALGISEDLLLITQLCGFIDDIQETFRSPALLNADYYQFDDAFTQLHMRRIELRLDAWQEVVDDRNLNGVSVTLAGRFARVLLYARALQPRALTPSHPSYPSPASGLRLSIYTYCLSAIKAFLDGVIHLSEAELNGMNSVDWIWTMSTFTALGRLSHHSLTSSSIDLGSLDVSGLHDRYTNAICSRVASSPTYSASKHSEWDFSVWIRRKCANSKQSSTHDAQPPATSSVGGKRATGPEPQGYDQGSSPNRTSISNLDLAFNDGELSNLVNYDWGASDFPWESLISDM